MFGKRLRQMREQLKEDQHVMARKLGVTSGTLSSIENGRTLNPGMDIIKNLFENYRLSPDKVYELITGESYRLPKSQQTKLELDLEEARNEIESLKGQLKNERTEKERWWETARDALQRIPEHATHKSQHQSQRGESTGKDIRAGKPVGSPDP